jgi:hypothetical protein
MDWVPQGGPTLHLQCTSRAIEREVRIIEQVSNLRRTERSLEEDRQTNQRSLAEIQYNLVRLGPTHAAA